MKRNTILQIVVAIASILLDNIAIADAITQCPNVAAVSEANTPWPSCAYLITANPDNSFTVTYDAQLLDDISNGVIDPEDILVGVQNNSGHSLFGFTITAPAASEVEFFDFDADFGLIYGPKGYEGPGVSFAFSPSDLTTGSVLFPTGLANGDSTYFGLEGSSQIDGNSIGLAVAAVPEPAEWGMLAAGLLALPFFLRRKANRSLFHPVLV